MYKKTKQAQQFYFNKHYFNSLLKVIGVGFFVSFILLFLIQVTGAYFIKGAITERTIPIGNVVIDATQVNNPYLFDKQIIEIPISVTNLSNTHIVLRAYLNFMWEEGYSVGDVELILANSNWTQGDDGFFYYNEVLTPFEMQNYIANFLQSIDIIDETGLRNNTNFIISVYFEGAQYANYGYRNLWLTAPQEWLNLISGGV